MATIKSVLISEALKSVGNQSQPATDDCEYVTYAESENSRTKFLELLDMPDQILTPKVPSDGQ